MTTIKTLTIGAITALCFFIIQPAYGQFWDKLTNSKYDVPVTHPPKVALKEGQKIIVREFTGECGAELTSRFSQTLTDSGKYQVIDRANLEQVMREQGIQSGTAFNPDSDMKLGQLLGAGAMFVGRITRCSIEQSPILVSRTTVNSGTYGPQHTYTIRITARITGNVQLVDLTTGKTLASTMVEGTNTLENSALGGTPESPSAEDARTGAYQNAVDQLKQMILPWTETVSLIVYDDHKMSLDRSAGQIKAGDFAGAVETLQAVVDAGMNDPKADKVYSKVYYNLGIAQMYSGQPDNAIKSLNKSAELRSTDITTEALATARQMQQLQKQAEIIEAHPVEIGKEDKPVVATETKISRLTNSDVLKMVAAKLPDSIIISKIKDSACQIDTSSDSLIALKNAGASDAVILEITQLPPTQKEN